MSVWSEIHWSEGMFLRPHHMQAFHRYASNQQRVLTNMLGPFGWGFAELEVSTEALENFQFEIPRCLARLKDGTIVRVPENTRVEPTDFKEPFEASNGSLNVYLGIPRLEAVRANASLAGVPVEGRVPRYAIEPMELYDENTGENPRQIEVRQVNGVLFFGDEDVRGYELIHVGRVVRSAKATALPELDRWSIPPLLAVQAWDFLLGRVRSIFERVAGKAGALARDAVDAQMTFSSGSPGHTDHLLKLQALNGMYAFFREFAKSPQIHPHHAYLEFCRLLGQLSIYHDDRVPPEFPSYDHENAGPCFKALEEWLGLLLDKMLPEAYEVRHIDRSETGLEVALEMEWIADKRELYVAIESDLRPEEIERHIRKIELKMASPSLASMIYKQGLPGLEFRQIKVVPSMLPPRPGLHYFKIGRDEYFWPKVEQERGLAVRVKEGQQTELDRLDFWLYICKTN